MMSASPFSTTSTTPNFRTFRPSVAPIYSFDWSPHSAHFCSLAVGSFVTQRPLETGRRNQVQLASLSDPQANDFLSNTSSSSSSSILSNSNTSSSLPITVEYPITKVQFSPHRIANGDSELLGVSGDGLRIYRTREHFQHELLVKLVPAQISTSPSASATASRRPSDSNIITSHPPTNPTNPTAISTNSPAPITSFDWNRTDPNILVTSSYDTTCAVWNLDTASVKTQLIAHDKEVFDVAFNPKSADIFASVGAEGSIRLFDIRSLDHSTILYETGDAQPLLRLAWNPLDNNYVACFGVDSAQVVIVDIRSAAVPVAILSNHCGAVSSIRWAPHNSGWLAAADAAGIKLWDVSQNVNQPNWALSTPQTQTSTLQSIVWPSSAPDWMAASTASEIHLIKL